MIDLDRELESIVIRCQAGEKVAFEELFALYQPRLKYYVRRLDGGSGKADDILQDIWLIVFKKIGKLKDVQAFGVWLYRIARNRVYSGFRRKERLVRLPEDGEIPASSGDAPAFDADDAERLHRALGKIGPAHREVLTLCFLEQMPYEAIAEVVGCRIGTVRSRIFYAKRSLRAEMERQNG